MWPIIVIALVVAVVIGGLSYLRLRRKHETRMISLVALLREPITLDPTVLAKTAGRVWNLDLGDGTTEGEDGFVVASGPINTIMCQDRAYLINCFPAPYVENPEEVSESIADLRIGKLFAEHKAWFSCDALGIDETTTPEEINAWYQHLAKLFSEFLDENCLLIYLPENSSAFPVNEETHQALESDDPVGALVATQTLPLVWVAEDDPLMQQAVARAREHWSEFVAAYEATAGENFSVKAPVSYSDRTEFIWLNVTALEGEQVYGTLASDPGDLGPLKLGSKVSVAVEDLNDWCYVDRQGELQGGYTIAAVQEAARRQHDERAE